MQLDPIEKYMCFFERQEDDNLAKLQVMKFSTSILPDEKVSKSIDNII